ncbi:MAG: hypothetical protein CMJ59_06855 [Planctomycetaceae bacterium]|nr:hypothetical protein [Planctomycetaceae bacterium]
MGWWNKLGESFKGGVQQLGHAAHETIDKATRLVHHIAPQVEQVAKKVANVAGTVGDYAGMASGIPYIGGVAAGVAAGAKAVQGAASGVASVAHQANKLERHAKKAKALVQGGMDLAANPNMQDALRYGKEVSSIARHSKANIQEARQQFSKIRKRGP